MNTFPRLLSVKSAIKVSTLLRRNNAVPKESFGTQIVVLAKSTSTTLELINIIACSSVLINKSASFVNPVMFFPMENAVLKVNIITQEHALQ